MSDLDTRLTEAFNREASRLTPGFPDGPREGGVYTQPWWLRTPVLAGAGVVLAAAVVALVVVIATKPDHRGDRLQVGSRPNQVQPATSTTVSSAPVTGSVPATFTTVPPSTTPTTAVPVVTPTSPVTLPTHTSAVGPVTGGGSTTTAPSVQACASSQLALAVVGVTITTPSPRTEMLTYSLTNTTATPCTLNGYPSSPTFQGSQGALTFSYKYPEQQQSSVTIGQGQKAYGAFTATDSCFGGLLPGAGGQDMPAATLALGPPGGAPLTAAAVPASPAFNYCGQSADATVSPIQATQPTG